MSASWELNISAVNCWYGTWKNSHPITTLAWRLSPCCCEKPRVKEIMRGAGRRCPHCGQKVFRARRFLLLETSAMSLKPLPEFSIAAALSQDTALLGKPATMSMVTHPPPVPQASVFIGVPTHSGIAPEAMMDFLPVSQRHKTCVMVHKNSLLTNGFNTILATALNERRKFSLTHWCLHHADLAASPGWLDTMLAEMHRVGADVLSCVIAIKDRRGLTSTGLKLSGVPGVRRLTLHETHQLPVTFCARDVGGPEYQLMVNTGLFLMRLDRPWAEEVCFRFEDFIGRAPDGTFRAG